MRVFELPEPNSHANVIEFRRRSHRHPSMMYDQDQDAADRCVLLTKAEAVRIAALLQSARSHLPSPKAVDEAVALLTGRRP